MVDELRRGFHDRIAGLHDEVASMASRVAVSMGRVNDALLESDEATAAELVGADAAIDDTYERVEREVFDLVALESPVARDLRFIIASLRIAQEVERCGDLVASVARRVPLVDQAALTPEMRALLYAMGAEVGRMSQAAADAYAVLDGQLAGQIPGWDDEVDEFHARLSNLLFATEGGPVRPVIELALIGRFYERVADHAVVMAERVRFVVSGEMHPGDLDSA